MRKNNQMTTLSGMLDASCFPGERKVTTLLCLAQSGNKIRLSVRLFVLTTHNSSSTGRFLPSLNGV